MAKADFGFEALMRLYAQSEDRRIAQMDEAGRDRVPPSIDEMVGRLACGALPAAPLFREAAKHIPRAAKHISRGAAVKAAAVGIAAAAAVSGATIAASPAARQQIRQAAEAIPAAFSQKEEKKPGDYEIPSPGSGFSVTDEAESERISAKWFTDSYRQVLVQIAYALPEEAREGGEAVIASGVMGALWEENGTEILVLEDGDVYILIKYFGADRQTIMDYAALLVRSNRVE